MRETNFIKQNKTRWSELENELKGKEKNPDKLSELFVHVTDDLSYSRTFYHNRYVRVYLNSLAQRIYLNIYKNKKSEFRWFLNFWKEELPLLIYHSRKELTVSFLVFLLAVGIGVFSSIHDPAFAQLVLGADYVEMTKKYIESGDPMKVYKTEAGIDMWMGITFNNLLVSFITYITGLVFAVGTLSSLLYNGIMVGTFQYFFIERGLFKESFLTIWMHGTIEISCIIIAGGAGLVLGRGLVFPGTYSRLQSLQISAQKSLKILLGIAPLIVLAAIIESFFTRYTDVPDLLRAGVIGLSAFFIFAYFVWYPIQKGRKSPPPAEIRIPPAIYRPFNPQAIRSDGELFADVFFFYRNAFGRLFSQALLVTLPAAAISWFAYAGEKSIYSLSGFYSLLEPLNVFDYSNGTLFFINSAVIAVNALLVMWLVIKQVKKDDHRLPFTVYLLRNSINAVLISMMLNAVLFLKGWAALFLPILFPFLVLWLFISIYENKNIFSTLRQLTNFISSGFLRIMGLWLSLVLVTLVIYFLFGSPLIWNFLMSFLKDNLSLNEDAYDLFYRFFIRFYTLLSINLLLPLSFIAFSLQYFTLKEIATGFYLRKRIDSLFTKNRTA